MREDSHNTATHRLAAEREQLVLRRFAYGSVGLAPLADVRKREQGRTEVCRASIWERVKVFLRMDDFWEAYPVARVCVPPGAYVILKGIPGSIQQRYGLQAVEGAVFVEIQVDDYTSWEALRFSNGSQVRLRDLGVGQVVEILSLAGTHAMLYESEFQIH